MLEKIKLDLNLNISTLIGLISLIGTTQAIIYKTTYFHSLGIKWYIDVFSTQQIFFSALQMVIAGTLGISIAISINLKLISKLKKVVKRYIVAIVTTLLLLLLIEVINKIGVAIGDEIELTLVLNYMIITGYLVVTDQGFKNGSSKELKTVIAIAIILSLYTSTKVAEENAKTTIEKFEEKETKVTINKEEWYLLEVAGNEGLLIKRKEKKIIYKIKALRDIDIIEGKKASI